MVHSCKFLNYIILVQRRHHSSVLVLELHPFGTDLPVCNETNVITRNQFQISSCLITQILSYQTTRNLKLISHYDIIENAMAAQNSTTCTFNVTLFNTVKPERSGCHWQVFLVQNQVNLSSNLYVSQLLQTIYKALLSLLCIYLIFL